MPEEEARESWQSLVGVADPAVRNTLINELARVMSPYAADLLARLWKPIPGLLITEPVAVLLDSMYRAGDADLKQHIEMIFARNGLAISDHPLFFPG